MVLTELTYRQLVFDSTLGSWVDDFASNFNTAINLSDSPAHHMLLSMRLDEELQKKKNGDYVEGYSVAG